MNQMKKIFLLGVLFFISFGIIVKGDPIPIPETPSNIQLTANDHKIVLSWDQADDAMTYEVEVDGVIMNNHTMRVYEHDNLIPLTTHNYRIRAVNSSGHSQWSQRVSAKTVNPKLVELNTLKMGKEMIQPRHGFATVSVNDKIYCLGGYGHDYIDSVEVYDPITDVWDILTVMPTKRYQAAVAAYQNELYVIGGCNEQDGVLDKLEVYNIEMDTWRELKRMPTKRSGAKAVYHDHKIYVIGGYNQEEKAMNGIDVYDIHSNTWTSIQPMPTKRSLMEAVIIGQKLYVMGGYNGFVLGDIEVYDIEQETWEKKGQMPIPRYAFSAVPLHQSILIIGGYHSAPFNTIELYTPDDDTFTSQYTLTNERFAFGAALIQDVLYAIGGTNEAVPLNGVEKAYTKIDPAPKNFNLQSEDSSFRLEWDKIDDTTHYEIEINGKVISNGTNPIYIQEEVVKNKNYYCRVRGLTSRGITQWSPYESYIKYSDQPSAYAYVQQRTKDIHNYETLDVWIMTKHIEDIYTVEIEGTYDEEQLEINSKDIEQLLIDTENNAYHYSHCEEGRFYLNVSLVGSPYTLEDLTKIYRINLNLKTLDATQLKINKINLVDSLGHIIYIEDICDLDIPSLY